MTIPTDIEFVDQTTVITEAWLDGINDWVNGAYGVLGGTYSAAAFRSALSAQASDATLTSLAALGTAADKMAYTTGVDTWAETAITSAARSLLDDATTGAMLTTLGAAASGANTDITSITSLGAGSAAAPSVARNSDGIYFPADNEVVVATAGAANIWAKNGNVAIGAAAPSGSFKLEVDGTLKHNGNRNFTSSSLNLAAEAGQTATSVSTATAIGPTSLGYGAIAIVNGYSGADAFTDLVFYNAASATAVNSKTSSGSPAARTYTVATNRLTLAMASGTYTVTVYQLSTNAF